MSQVDVLIITALKEEYEAAQEAGLRGYADNPGIAAWEDRDLETPTPYVVGSYSVASGASMSVALARSTRTGANAIGPVVSSLVERLKPECLAMSGVCAGNPAVVALGDVIVAELAYAYDEGKRTQQSFEGDHRQVPLSDAWVRSAQDLSANDLPSFREASDDEAKIWLLERLNACEDPRAHPARPRYFPRSTWSRLPRSTWGQCLLSLRQAGHLEHDGAVLSLTEEGRSFVQQILYDDVDGPERLPFRVVVGPIASGNVVVKDGRTWEQLKKWAVRTVVGLEMEAATIANTAHRLDVANWVVVKGVMDHADLRKDDRYKPFAARASAEVLFKLLGLRIISRKSPRNQGKVTDLQEPVDTLRERTAAVLRTEDERVDRIMAAFGESPSFETITEALQIANYMNAFVDGIATVQGGADPADDKEVDLENPLSVRVRFLWGSHPGAPGSSLLVQVVCDEDLYLSAHQELIGNGFNRRDTNDRLCYEIVWKPDHRAENVGAQIREGLISEGIYRGKATFEWGKAITELRRTIGVAIASRRGGAWPAASLFELVGGDWAITRVGVEYKDREEFGPVFMEEDFPSWYPGGRDYRDPESSWHLPQSPPGVPEPSDRLLTRAAAYLPLRNSPNTPYGWNRSVPPNVTPR